VGSQPLFTPAPQAPAPRPPVKQRSHALPIIDPNTNQEVDLTKPPEEHKAASVTEAAVVQVGGHGPS
jgi:hypothetical protein